MNVITIIRRVLNYALNNPEFSVTAFILTGLVILNKSFAYTGVGGVYITEFLTVMCLICFAFKFIISSYATGGLLIRKDTVITFLIQFWPLMLILIFSVVRIFMDINYGIQTLRHSMIFLYTILFTGLFMVSIKNEKQLFFLLVYIIIVVSS